MKTNSILIAGLMAGLMLTTPVSAAGNTAAKAPWTAYRLSAAINGEDDWESFNRAMFWIDDVVMDYIACPGEYIYGSIVPKPLVKGIDNAVDNSEYPIRLFASLFRAEGGAAWDETCRFLINTTVGLGGLFDPAQNWFGLIDSGASFAGTFAAWGIPKGPSCVVPVVPHNNLRDDCGYIVDLAFDPKTYIDVFCPTGIWLSWSLVFWPNYGMVWIDPWESNITPAPDRYESFRSIIGMRSLLTERLAGYRYATDAVAGRAETHRPPVRAALERPAGLKGRWRDVANFEPRTPALDTLRLSLFAPKADDDFWWMRHSLWNSDFAHEVTEREISYGEERPAAHYGFIPAPEHQAPGTSHQRLVFVIPGIGTTHAARTTLAMAEILHDAGTAVVTCDDPFHWAYMVSAGEGRLPGYLPDDAKRFAAFAKAVVDDLQKEELVDEPEVSFVGWSMGGLLTAHLATLPKDAFAFRTGDFLALNPPVSYGSINEAMEGLLAPSCDWNQAEAETNLLTTLSRILLWDEMKTDPTPDLSEAEAGYACAFLMGTTLPQLVAIATGTNEDVTVGSYFRTYLKAAYPDLSVGDLLRGDSLRTHGPALRANTRFSVIHTRDDFLLTADDRLWLDSNFTDQITWFSVGAHCGMFYTPEFRDELLTRLNLKK